jgi:SAM-dependent methyltransferase
MSRRFYDRIAMGSGFLHNPVLSTQRAQIERFLPPDGTRRDVLDLGCGAGSTTLALVDDPDRFRVVGADVSESALAEYVTATGRPAVRLDAERLPFDTGRFDVVISDDVIEHLVDTDAYAREVHRVLASGGLLMLTTPNLAAWFNRLGLLAGVQPAFSEVSFEKVFGRPGYDIVGHLRLFTQRSILQFLDHHRFAVLETKGARFDALPRKLHRIDGAVAKITPLAGNTVVVARRRD